MQIDVDYYTRRKFPFYLNQDNGNDQAVVRMYGITDGGHSVMLHIHNFLPYLYV